MPEYPERTTDHGQTTGKKSLKGIRIRISKKNRQRNGQKDKQRSTKHTYKNKDRVTRTPLKTGGEFRCFISATFNNCA
jgi:hypothetical protein